MNEKRKRILVCEDSIEGILSAIHQAFVSRYGHAYQQVQTRHAQTPDLFSDMVDVAVDVEKAVKVADSVKCHISERAWWMIRQAAEAGDGDRADVIYRFLILGFANGPKALDAMARPEVMRLHQLSRSVSREAQHLYGFLRFQEVKGGILYGKLVSKHHVGPFLADHFADRLPMEHWLIHDPERDEVWIHQAGHPWIYMQHPDFLTDPEQLLTPAEYDFKAWWQTFTRNIAIQERRNLKLQMQMMPKRYWKYMPEMQKYEEVLGDNR